MSRVLGWARTIVGLVGVLLVGTAIVVFLVVYDVQFVLHVYERSETSTLVAVIAATAALVGTIVGVVWFKRSEDHVGRRARRVLGRVAIAWSILFLIAFFWTHPMNRDEHLGSPVHAGLVTYVVLVVVVAVALFPYVMFRLSRPKPHRPHDRVRVWRLRDKQPYLVAYCDCGWVGAPHDDDEPHSRDSAFREARAHGTNVAPQVEDPAAETDQG
jgi:O-antigen/teichoic acid export membrane protein